MPHHVQCENWACRHLHGATDTVIGHCTAARSTSSPRGIHRRAPIGPPARQPEDQPYDAGSQEYGREGSRARGRRAWLEPSASARRDAGRRGVRTLADGGRNPLADLARGLDDGSSLTAMRPWVTRVHGTGPPYSGFGVPCILLRAKPSAGSVARGDPAPAFVPGFDDGAVPLQGPRRSSPPRRGPGRRSTILPCGRDTSVPRMPASTGRAMSRDPPRPAVSRREASLARPRCRGALRPLLPRRASAVVPVRAGRAGCSRASRGPAAGGGAAGLRGTAGTAALPARRSVRRFPPPPPR